MRRLGLETLEPRRMLRGPAPTISTLQSSAPSAIVGTAITFTDAVKATSGTPSGLVEFIIDGRAFGYEPLRNGISSIVDKSLNIGTHTISADFLPAGGWQGSSSTIKEVITAKPVVPPPPPPVPPPPVTPPPATGHSIQIAGIDYDASQTEAQTAWNGHNFQVLIGPDPSYVPTYAAEGATSYNYLNFYSMYVGSSEWVALQNYCTANSLPIESMLLHFAVSTTVTLPSESSGDNITFTLAAGSRVPSYAWYAGTNLSATGSRVMMNLYSPAFQKFLATYAPTQLAGGYTGLFIDNASMSGLLLWNNGLNTSGPVAFQESPAGTPQTINGAIAALETANVQCIAAIHNAGIKSIINIGEDAVDPAVLPYVNSVYMEFIDEVSSEDAYWAGVLQTNLAAIHAAGDNGIVSVTEATTAAQEMDALATFYTFANPNDYFCLQNSNGGNLESTAYFGALATNIGGPSGPAVVLEAGKDSAGNVYDIYERQYSDGLALFAPYADYNDLSGPAVTVQLGGSFEPLNADGTLGAAVSSVQIEPGEGVVLVN